MAQQRLGSPVEEPDLDLYGILNVPKDASDDELLKAYRGLAMLCHPDKVPGSSSALKAVATEQFNRIRDAYEILSDPQRREVRVEKRRQSRSLSMLHSHGRDSLHLLCQSLLCLLSFPCFVQACLRPPFLDGPMQDLQNSQPENIARFITPVGQRSMSYPRLRATVSLSHTYLSCAPKIRNKMTFILTFLFLLYHRLLT